MTTLKVLVDGVEYPLAPMEPLVDDHPAPSNAQYMAFTPAIAKAWLNYNRHNRNHRRRSSVDLGRDVAAKAFQVNGESIKVSRPLKDGENENVPAGDVLLLDGQHRLIAIANMPPGNAIVILVTWGLDPEVQETIDIGNKRTSGDMFRLRGKANPNVLASIVRRVGAWEKGDTRFHLNYAFTPRETKDILDRNPEIYRSAEIACRTRREFTPARQSVTGITHFLFTKIDEGDAAWFFQRLGDGAEMPKEHPIMRLRKRLTDERESRSVAPDWKQVVYFIRAWNAYRTDNFSFVLFGRSDDKGDLPKPV